MLGTIEQKLIVASRTFSVSLQDAHCLEWSQDNRLALVTPSSVIVYDVETSCSDVTTVGLALSQHTMAAPHLPNPHFSSSSAITSEGRPSDKASQVMLPLALSAPLSYASRSVVAVQNLPPGFDVTYTGYRRATWSPPGAGGLHRCVLALLTSDHRLLLACGKGRRLRPSLSLGRRWAQYLAAHNWPLVAPHQAQEGVLQGYPGDSRCTGAGRGSASAAPTGHRSAPAGRRAAPAGHRTEPADHRSTPADSVQQHSPTLSQLAIKLVCWSPVVTQCAETGLWQSDLLHISLSGHTVIWRVTAGQREASSPRDCRAGTKASVHSGQHKTENVDKEDDGSNFLDAVVCGTFDSGSCGVCCAKWWAGGEGASELLLLGDVMGLLRVFQVVRGPEGVVETLQLLATLLTADRMSVTDIEVLEMTSSRSRASPGPTTAPTVTAADQPRTAPSADSGVVCRTSSPASTKQEQEGPSDIGPAEQDERELLVVVSRAMSISCLLLGISEGCCRLRAAAQAYVSRMTITAVSAHDLEHVYCCTRDGHVLHVSVVEHQGGLTSTHTTSTPQDNKQEETRKLCPEVVSASPARAYDGVQESVVVHRVEVRNDCTEHTEVITLPGQGGRASRLSVVCSRQHDCSTSLSLRRRVLRDYTSEGASYLAMVPSPNSVFYATVESLRVPYDHLVMRESSRLTVSLVCGPATLQQHLTSTAHRLPLHLTHDFLAASRILAVDGTVLDLAPLLEKLPSVQEEDDPAARDAPDSDTREQDALRVLQLLVWLLRLYTKLGPAAQPPTAESWAELQQRLLEQLLQPWLERVVRVYHDNDLWRPQDLLPLVKASLSLMCDHLVVRGPNHHSTRAMAVLLRLGGGTREQCAVGSCELMVPLASLTEARCADGHVLPRCCVSLLPVLRSDTCELCATVLHRLPADALCGGEALCSLCGGVMESATLSSSDARVVREGSKLLPRTSLVLLNTKNRKGKSLTNAQRI